MSVVHNVPEPPPAPNASQKTKRKKGRATAVRNMPITPGQKPDKTVLKRRKRDEFESTNQNSTETAQLPLVKPSVTLKEPKSKKKKRSSAKKSRPSSAKAKESTSSRGRGRGRGNGVDLFKCLDDEKEPAFMRQHVQRKANKLWTQVEKKCRTQLTCIEFCCGGGGLACGLKKAGFHKLALVDILPVATQTCSVNMKDDITLLANLLDVHGTKDGFHQLDLLCAGLPCQSFSLLGKRETWDHGKKGTSLWGGFLKIVNSLQPKLVVIENVSPCAGDIMRSSPEVLATFNDIGYRITNQVLNSNAYNVPQARMRMFLVAVNKRLTDRSFNYETVPVDLRYPKFKQVFNPPVVAPCTTLGSAKLNEVIQQIKPGQRFEDLPTSVQKRLKTDLGVNLRPADLRRPDPERPCPTITTSGGAQSGWGCILHPTESRPLNIVEAARVQTFPDDWCWGVDPRNGTSDVYLQVGNAVPVNMGYHMGCALNLLLAECAVENPTNFSPIEDKEAWLNDHVALFNGSNSSSMLNNHHLEHPFEHTEQSSQYRGSYWRYQVDYAKQTQWYPDRANFLFEDEVTLELWDGEKQQTAHGVVTVITKDTVGMEVTHQGRKYYHSLQQSYKKFEDIKGKSLKEGEFVVTGVKHFQYTQGQHIVRAGFAHTDGRLVASCRRLFSGRLFTYVVPAVYLLDMPTVTDRCGRTIQQHCKHHGIDLKPLECRDRWNNPSLEFRDAKAFTPVFIRVEGHNYPLGTKLEINQVNKNGSKTRHWSGATIIESGEDENGKEYRMIKVDSVKVLPAGLLKQKDLLLGKDKDIVKAFVQKEDGRFRIKYGLYLACRPVCEPADVKDYVGDGKKDNYKQRERITARVKLACRWKNALGKDSVSIVNRSVSATHSYNKNFGEGVVKILTNERWSKIRKQQTGEADLPEVGSSEFGILTRTGTIERVLIRGISEYCIAFCFKDGRFEAHPRDHLIIKYIGAPSSAELKTFTALKKRRDVPLSSYKMGDEIVCCRETGRVLGRRAGAGRPATKKTPNKKRGKGRKRADSHEDDFIDNGKGSRKRDKNGLVIAERCSVGFYTQEVAFTPWQMWQLNEGVITGCDRADFAIPEEEDLRQMDWIQWRNLCNGKIAGKKSKQPKDFAIGWFDGVRWTKGKNAPGGLKFKVNQKFANRIEAYYRGLHRQTMRGISCGPNGVCESVCFGGGYADDTHDLDVDESKKRPELWYTGEGFQKSGDQKMTKGNLGMQLAYEKKQSVRVLMKKRNNPLRAGDGFHYLFCGLYKIVESQVTKSEHLMQKVMKVRLVYDEEANKPLGFWKKQDERDRLLYNAKARAIYMKKAEKIAARQAMLEKKAKEKMRAKQLKKRSTGANEPSFLDTAKQNLKHFHKGIRLGEYGAPPPESMEIEHTLHTAPVKAEHAFSIHEKKQPTKKASPKQKGVKAEKKAKPSFKEKRPKKKATRSTTEKKVKKVSQ